MGNIHLSLTLMCYLVEGLGHSITAPPRARRNLFLENDEFPISRSMTEKWEGPRPELTLDRLSEIEKVNNATYLHSACKFTIYTWHLIQSVFSNLPYALA